MKEKELGIKRLVSQFEGTLAYFNTNKKNYFSVSFSVKDVGNLRVTVK